MFTLIHLSTHETKHPKSEVIQNIETSETQINQSNNGLNNSVQFVKPGYGVFSCENPDNSFSNPFGNP